MPRPQTGACRANAESGAAPFLEFRAREQVQARSGGRVCGPDCCGAGCDDSCGVEQGSIEAEVLSMLRESSRERTRVANGYLRLVMEFPLRRIRTRKEHEEAVGFLALFL